MSPITTDQNIEELEFDLDALCVDVHAGEWTCPKCDAINESGPGHDGTVTCRACGDTFSAR